MWLVEKKVVHHLLDLGFERVDIPILVKFEFEVREGCFVRDSLSTQTLYNRQLLEKRYPQLNMGSLEACISHTANQEIVKYLRGCGFSGEDDDFCRLSASSSS